MNTINIAQYLQEFRLDFELYFRLIDIAAVHLRQVAHMTSIYLWTGQVSNSYIYTMTEDALEPLANVPIISESEYFPLINTDVCVYAFSIDTIWHLHVRWKRS